MSLINVNHLTFAYEGSYDNIFENVSFQLDTDWKLGFTGRNGRGKTTFLKLLTGEYPYQGRISAKVDFDYFPFPAADGSLPALDVAEQIAPMCEYWQLSRELHYLEMSDEVLYRPFSTLSKGEQTKLLLAALFLKENNFLLIDEPTNHLDVHGRQVVADYLNRKKGFILVSHDRAFLDACTDHILSINKTSITVQKGNFSDWLYNKELQDQFELAENEKLNRQIKSMEAAARRTARWSDIVEKRKTGGNGGDAGVKADKGHIGAQAAKMMKRSKAAAQKKEAAIASKEKLLKNIERADALKIHPLHYHSDTLVSLDRVSCWYDPALPLFSDLSFTIRAGSRIALQGPNGSGKSSLLKLILAQAGAVFDPPPSAACAAVCGSRAENANAVPAAAGPALPAYSGTIRTGSGLKISYVSQDTSHLQGSLDAFARARDIDVTLFRTVLRKLDFERVQFEKNMEHYSGGQKKKVLIAASLCSRAHLYIWDEPLNFIDVLSRMQIEELLLTFEPAMLFVEHDRMFCEKTATETITL